jgi:hypothetical protein
VGHPECEDVLINRQRRSVPAQETRLLRAAVAVCGDLGDKHRLQRIIRLHTDTSLLGNGLMFALRVSSLVTDPCHSARGPHLPNTQMYSRSMEGWMVAKIKADRHRKTAEL